MVQKISIKYENFNILDLGSGNCYLSFHLLKKGNKVTSVSFDNFNNEKAYCRSKKLGYKNHKIIYQDICDEFNTFNNDKLFDKVLLLETIEHIKDDLKLLKNINKNLSTNGELIVTTPYKNFKSLLKSDYLLNIGHGSHVRHGYDIQDLQEKLKETGFKIVRYNYLTSNLTNYTSQILRYLSIRKLSFLSTLIKLILLLPLKYFSNFNLTNGNYIALIAKKIN